MKFWAMEYSIFIKQKTQKNIHALESHLSMWPRVPLNFNVILSHCNSSISVKVRNKLVYMKILWEENTVYVHIQTIIIYDLELEIFGDNKSDIYKYQVSQQLPSNSRKEVKKNSWNQEELFREQHSWLLYTYRYIHSYVVNYLNIPKF